MQFVVPGSRTLGSAASLAIAAALLLLPFALGSCGDRPSPSGEGAPAARYDQEGRLLTEAPKPERPPNLVIVLIDTLRRDSVALRESESGVMPALTALARRGVACAEATAPAPWTVPSVVSMLTGMLPHEHGCTSGAGTPRLPAAVTTYAEILRNAYGYETAIFTGAPWFGKEKSSILQGFAGGDVGRGFGLQGTRPVLEAWNAKRDATRPHCLVLHTFEAHDPYGKANHPYPDTTAGYNLSELHQRIAAFDVSQITEPWQMTRLYMMDRIGRGALRMAYGDEYMDLVVEYSFDGYGKQPRPELAAELRKAYVDGVTWVDGLLDASVRTMDEMGLLENTLLVVLGDHGEAFGEDGVLGHGRSLTDALVRVPLVFVGPGPFATPAVIDASVGLVDVFPTFFDFAGLAQPVEQVGASVLPLLKGIPEPRPVVSEEVLEPHNTRPGMNRLRRSVRDGRWKYLIEYDLAAGKVSESIYDLAADPAEESNLADKWPAGVFPWGDAFCETVSAVRESIWNQIDDHQALEGTMYAGSRPLVKLPRPQSCKAPSGP